MLAYSVRPDREVIVSTTNGYLLESVLNNCVGYLIRISLYNIIVIMCDGIMSSTRTSSSLETLSIVNI